MSAQGAATAVVRAALLGHLVYGWVLPHHHDDVLGLLVCGGPEGGPEQAGSSHSRIDCIVVFGHEISFFESFPMSWLLQQFEYGRVFRQSMDESANNVMHTPRADAIVTVILWSRCTSGAGAGHTMGWLQCCRTTFCTESSGTENTAPIIPAAPDHRPVHVAIILLAPPLTQRHFTGVVIVSEGVT